MADKARTSFTIPISFSDGELPSAAKLSGLAKQARQGLNLIEHIVGDVWNQSGDSILNSIEAAAIMTPNLARALGPLRNANPRIPALPNIGEYTHLFLNDLGNYEARLSFPPASGTTYTWTGTTTRSTTPEILRGLVAAAGEWYIDTDTGNIFTWDAFAADDKLTYVPEIVGDIDSSATFNAIPDPDTSTSFNFRGVKIQYVNSSDDSEGYYIYLPPRMPLGGRRVQHSPQDSVHVPSHSGNFYDDPNATPGHDMRFWQTDSSDASTTAGEAEHYRYVLPAIITDNWSQAATIPTGLVYLWDPTGNKTVIEGLIYTAENAAVPRKWVLKVSGANLTSWLTTTIGATAYPTATLQSSSHIASMYPNTGLRLITVGSSISATLSSLYAQFLNHDHSSSNSLVARPISHALLSNSFDAGGTPWFDQSSWIKDDHPQYLHRHGTENIGTSRDTYHNSMLGHLLMASTSTTSSHRNMSADSNKLIFGDNFGDLGVNIYFEKALEGLHIKVPNISNVGTFKISRAGTNSLSFVLNSTGPVNQISSDVALEIISTSSTVHIKSTRTSIQSPAATYDGEGGVLYSNRIFPGSIEDITYGWSHPSSDSGYGPIRRQILPCSKFVHLTATAASSPIFPTIHDQEHLRFSNYNATNKHQSIVMKLLSDSGANLYYLWAPVDLPYQEYIVVGVEFSAVPEGVVDLSASQIFVGLEQMEVNTSGVSGNTILKEDLFNMFGAIKFSDGFPTATIASSWTSTSSTSSQRVSQIPGDTTNSLAIKIWAGAGVDKSMLIKPVMIWYRVKEF